jgi:hypothetical protein
MYPMTLGCSKENVPVPLYGTNSTSLIMAIMDVSDWLNSVQKPTMSGYNSAVSHLGVCLGGGGGGGQRPRALPPPPAGAC